MQEIKLDYENQRKEFLKQQDNLKTNKDRQALLDNTEEGANEKLRTGNREKLLNNQDNLKDGSQTINRIEDLAIDTHKEMVDATGELKDQGHMIDRAQENITTTGLTVDKTKRMVNQMSRKEYWYKFLLYMLVVLIFIVDVVYLIVKLFGI